MQYNLDNEIIFNLDNTDFKNSKYYTFNYIDFYYKINNSKYLLITFHGALAGTLKNDNYNKNLYDDWGEETYENSKWVRSKIPLFRCYNYTKFDVLCLSDILLKLYPKNLQLGWFLSKEYEKYYIDIIKYISGKYLTKNIIISGSSGGAFASLYYGDMFNFKRIVFNGQILIKNHAYYTAFKSIVNNELISHDNLDLKNRNNIIIYQCINDEHHYINLKKYLSYNKYNDILVIYFENNKNVNPHSCLFPEDISTENFYLNHFIC